MDMNFYNDKTSMTYGVDHRLKALETAQKYFERAAANSFYRDWRRLAIENRGFDDGTGQWPLKLLAKMRGKDIEPIVVNKIKSMVNQMAGIEISSQTRIAFRSHSGKEEEELLAKGLSHFGFAIQESEDMAYKGSLKFRDATVMGIGWSNLFKDKSQICYEYIDPLNIIYDADDYSPQLSNMRFIIRMRWLAADEIKVMWPRHAKEIDSMVGKNHYLDNLANFSEEHDNRFNPTVSSYKASSGGSKILVVEVQYKKQKKCYCGYDYQGFWFETFDEDEAVLLADGKNDIEEKLATQVIRTVFCRDLLLESKPLQPNIPNIEDFTYIPCVWSRRGDGVPDGWVSILKDLQRELNYRKFKENRAIGSARVIMDADALNFMTEEQIREEAARPDSVLVKNRDSTLEIHPNIDIAAGQRQAAERIDFEMEQVTGLHRDMSGEQSNATSGVAIMSRQRASARNQSPGLYNMRMMKKREGRMLLNLIQMGGDENLRAQVLTPEESEVIYLNLVREVEGKKYIFNDIRTLPMSIYVEEVQNYESSFEEQQATLEAILSNPNATTILQSRGLLKLLGVREYEKIASEMQQNAQQQMQMEQAARGGGQMPPPQAMPPEQMPQGM
jgi:hypothetical protein